MEVAQNKCNSKLPCGHLCIHHCHPIDQDHRDIFKCSAICCKVMDCSHPCILTCHTVNDVRGCFCESCTPKTVCETNKKCDVKLQCGHSCLKKCQHTADVDHTELCEQVCGQLRDCGHACTLPCHFPKSSLHSEPSTCSKCSKQVDATKTLILPAIGDQSNCSHGKPLTSKCKIKCGVKLQCGHSCRKTCRHTVNKDHTKLCEQVCGQLRDCGHPCTLPCHFPKSSLHSEPSTCSKCSKQVDATKTLVLPAIGDQSKCSHGKSLTTKCKIKCGVKLPCGHSCRKTCRHTVNKDHTKLCEQVCGQRRDCGHACTLLCHFPMSSLHNNPSMCSTCSKQVDATKTLILPAIGDQSKCSHGKSLTTKCKIECGVKLQCGHSCRKTCRHTVNKDHTKLCEQVCGQLRDCGHPCTLLCHFPKSSLHNDPSMCSTCSKQVDATKTLVLPAIGDQSKCSHGKPLTSKCKIECGVKLQCGHSCRKTCRHTANKDHTKLCEQMCGQQRDCGHACTLQCHFPKTSHHNEPSICSTCSKQVDATKTLIRQAIGDLSKCSHGKSLTTNCQKKCGVKLRCGHSCREKCRHTFNNDHAKFCEQVCGQLSGCGHACTLLCHFPKSCLHIEPSICSKCCKKVDEQIIIRANRDRSKCYHGMSWTTKCKIKCGVKLRCGHSCLKECRHTADIDHTQLCEQVCGQLRDCGHACTLQCHFSMTSLHNEPSICSKCCKQVDEQIIIRANRDRSKCYHGISWTTKCKKKCGVKLRCGHSCLKECRHTADIDHTKLCEQVCGQLRDCGHACTLLCHFPKTSLHNEPFICSSHGKSLTTKCKIKCGVKLRCGHSCLKECRHTADIDHTQLCEQVCGQLRGCGHACTLLCHFPKTSLHNEPSICSNCCKQVDEQIIIRANRDRSKCFHGMSWTTKCEIKCGVTLRCGHSCLKDCRHTADIDHTKLCEQVCSQLRGCGHACTLLCHFPKTSLHNEPSICSKCCKQVDEQIIIRANRDRSKCYHKLSWTTKCKKKCGVKLRCGHSCLKVCRHTADVDHTQSCERVCSQLRGCGHACTLPCHIPKSFLHNDPSMCSTCSKQVDATKTLVLQPFGDQSKCSHGKPLTSKCKIKCGVKLQCGHSCREKCRHTVNKDHTKLCEQVCGQRRDCGHACTLLCHFPMSSLHNNPSMCSTCSKQVDATKTLVLPAIGDQSKCSHGKPLTSNRMCKIECGVKLQCGHSCRKTRRHTANKDHTKLCKQMCGQLRDCGHACSLQCHFPKTSLHNEPSTCSKCSKQVDATKTLILPAIGDQSKCSHGKSLTTKCTIKCGIKLQCGHSCRKTWLHTADIGHTNLCEQACRQRLDCGHACNLPCHFPKSSEPSICGKCSKQVYKQTILQAIGDRSKGSHGTSLSCKRTIKCGVKLQCGHSCLSKCQHVFNKDHTKLCKQVCSEVRGCGHACTLQCHFPKSSLHNDPSTCSKCSKQVEQIILQATADPSKCSHGPSPSRRCSKQVDATKTLILQAIGYQSKCGVKLQRGHSCRKKCGHPANKDHIELCEQVCGQLRDCGHASTLLCHFPKTSLHNEYPSSGCTYTSSYWRSFQTFPWDVIDL